MGSATGRVSAGRQLGERERGSRFWLAWARRSESPGAIIAAGGPMLVAAGGSAALGLAGHLVGAWGAAGRGSAGGFEVHTTFPRPGWLDQSRCSDNGSARV